MCICVLVYVCLCVFVCTPQVIVSSGGVVHQVGAKPEQKTLILGEIARSASSQDILGVFASAVSSDGSACPGPLSVRSDMNDTWYARDSVKLLPIDELIYRRIFSSYLLLFSMSFFMIVMMMLVMMMMCYLRASLRFQVRHLFL